MRSTFFDVFMLFLDRIPYLLVLLVGLIMAISRRHRAPRAMRLLAIGFGLLLFTSIADQFDFTLLPRSLGVSAIASWYIIDNLIHALLLSGGMIFILRGAFADRKPPEERGFPVVFDSSPPASRPPQGPPPL